jgi:hypothetical protein
MWVGYVGSLEANGRDVVVCSSKGVPAQGRFDGEIFTVVPVGRYPAGASGKLEDMVGRKLVLTGATLSAPEARPRRLPVAQGRGPRRRRRLSDPRRVAAAARQPISRYRGSSP